MKRFSVVLGMALLAACVLGTGVAHSQSTGSIVGWGDQVVVEPASLEGIIAVAAGAVHSLGLKSDGTIVAWGYNSVGQCNVPAPNADFVAVTGGDWHSLGLKSDSTIVAWGYNYYGQCNVPAPNADFVAVAAGAYHGLGLKSDGTIVAWGYNYYGQCDVPPPNANFVAVAAGAYYSLGLKSDGTIVAWGDNDAGQCGVPAPNANFVAVAAGYEHSLGLKSDGTIVAWGDNNYGQCNVPAPNADFVAVAAGGLHSLGLKTSSSDTMPPSKVTNLQATVTDTSINLVWTPATDNVGVHHYIVYRDTISGFTPEPGDSIAAPSDTVYIDKDFQPGVVYYYRVSAVDFSGNEGECSDQASGVHSNKTIELPHIFLLFQNYPNPFNPVTEIKYTLSRDCWVKLGIFNVSGQEVAILVDEVQTAGYRTVRWNAGSLSSGIYFCRLKAGDFVQTRKMVLLR